MQLHFLRIILNFYQGNHIALIQNESYQQSPEKNESSINKVLREWKKMVSTRDSINTLVSRVHSLMLQTYIYRLEINNFRALLTKYFVVWAEFPMGTSHFFQWKMLFPIHWQILKILGNGISQSFMLSLKCSHPFLCEYPILFLTVKIKLGQTFPNSSIDWKFGLELCILPSFSQFIKEMGNWGFWKI